MESVKLYLYAMLLSAAVDPESAAFWTCDAELGVGDWYRLTDWFHERADRLGWVFAPGSSRAWGCS